MWQKVTHIIKSFCSLIKKEFMSIWCDHSENYFNVLVELLHYAIIHNDQTQANHILGFLSDKFKEIFQNPESDNHKLDCYAFVLETNELICREDYIHILYRPETNTYLLPLSFLLPKETYSHELCKKDLDTIWTCLLQIVTYKRWPLLLSYWQYAYAYNENYSTDNLNFILFNYEVLALITSQERYDILHDIIFMKSLPNSTNVSSNVFFKGIHLHHIKLININQEDIILTYLSYVSSKEITKRSIPNKISTEQVNYPLLEYGKKYFSIIYILAEARNSHIPNRLMQNDDFPILEQIDLPSLHKYIRILELGINETLHDKEVLEAFKIKEDSQKYISLQPFSDFAEQYIRMKTRIADFEEKQIDDFDTFVEKEINKALNRCSIFTRKKRFKNRKEVGIFAIDFLSKTLLCSKNKKLTNTEISSLLNRIFCLLCQEMINSLSFLSLEKKEITTMSRVTFLEKLDLLISKIKYKDRYIIVTDTYVGQNIFTDHLNKVGEQSTYKGIDVYMAPYFSKDKTSCRIWLLKKKDLPYCRLSGQTIPTFEEYRFTKIKDYYFRLLLDLGRTPSELLEQLKETFEMDKLKDKYTNLVLTIIWIPITVSYPMNSIIREFVVDGLEPYQDDDDYGDFEDYEGPYTFDEIIRSQILSVEQVNKKSLEEEKRIKLRNKK